MGKFFSLEEAKWIGEQLGIYWIKYSPEQFKMGLEVELEHGIVDPSTNITNDDLIMTGKISAGSFERISGLLRPSAKNGK